MSDITKILNSPTPEAVRPRSIARIHAGAAPAADGSRSAAIATEREHHRLRKAMVCDHCGRLFFRTRAGSMKRKFCSQKGHCASQAEVQRRWPKRHCRQCRKTFHSRDEANAYCLGLSRPRDRTSAQPFCSSRCSARSRAGHSPTI